MEVVDDLGTVDFRRVDAEWTTLNAVREALGIACKGFTAPTYEESLLFGGDLAPQLFGRKHSILRQAQTSEVIREYEQRADAESLVRDRTVSPLDIVDRQIRDCEILLRTPGQRDQLKRRLEKLRQIRLQLGERNFSENRLLNRDVYTAARPDLPQPPIDTDSYREYTLKNGKTLRLRLLHPDTPEHTTGADLIYEICDSVTRTVQLALVQYKIWTGKALYASGGRNIEKQIHRLRKVACKRELCNAPKGFKMRGSYRLPFCAAFLRPTDRLQSVSAQLVSKGLHVPVCTVRRFLKGKHVLRKASLDSTSIGSRAFEELFARGIAGSRAISYHEVEKLYHAHGILREGDKIVVHAQEFELNDPNEATGG